MGRPKSTFSTPAELEILTSLTRRGVATVRDIQDDFRAANRNVAYTSIATIIRIMVQKKDVSIVDQRRPQKFKALTNLDEQREAQLRDVIARCFGGDVEAVRVILDRIKPRKKGAA